MFSPKLTDQGRPKNYLRTIKAAIKYILFAEAEELTDKMESRLASLKRKKFLTDRAVQQRNRPFQRMWYEIAT